MRTYEMKGMILKAIIETQRRMDETESLDVKLINLGKNQAYQKVWDALFNRTDGLKCDL